MSFELTFVVPPDKDPPDPGRAEQVVAKLPHTKRQRAAKDCLWQYEYLNPETGVVSTFRCVTPQPAPTGVRGQRDSGLTAEIPFLCPTFMAREALPLVEQVGRALQLGAFTPSGDHVADCDAGRLQILWSDGNKRTLERFGLAEGRMPPYMPRERLDEMWRYMNARHVLETRYAAKGIYVPRIILLKNKLDRKQIFLTAMWAEMGPAVFPEVDAFVVGKPTKILGLFATGDSEPVVVRSEVVMEHVRPLLRQVDRPVAHQVLEDAERVRKPVLRGMGKVLTPPFTTFETMGVEELVDVQV